MVKHTQTNGRQKRYAKALIFWALEETCIVADMLKEFFVFLASF